MSAAIAEVAIPAAKTNDKATLFIKLPLLLSLLVLGVVSWPTTKRIPRSAPCAAWNFTN